LRGGCGRLGRYPGFFLPAPERLVMLAKERQEGGREQWRVFQVFVDDVMDGGGPRGNGLART